jgi:hypothetical protein
MASFILTVLDWKKNGGEYLAWVIAGRYDHDDKSLKNKRKKLNNAYCNVKRRLGRGK